MIRIDDCTLLLFVGSPRTGSTLLGQLINFHPECFIANESRFLHKIFVQKVDINKAFKAMHKDAQRHFKSGLENVMGEKRMCRYQPKWKAMKHLTKDPDFKKTDIMVVGDKKAGGATQIYMEHEAEFDTFLNERNNVKLLQIVRNPINASLSYIKSHEKDSFSSACKDIVQRSKIAFDLCQKHSKISKVIFYEDLLENPYKIICQVIEWLGLHLNERWASKVTEVVNASIGDIKISQNYNEIMLQVIKEYRAKDLLNRYC